MFPKLPLRVIEEGIISPQHRSLNPEAFGVSAVGTKLESGFQVVVLPARVQSDEAICKCWCRGFWVGCATLKLNPTVGTQNLLCCRCFFL